MRFLTLATAVAEARFIVEKKVITLPILNPNIDGNAKILQVHIGRECY
jgi:hypothetical protein